MWWQVNDWHSETAWQLVKCCHCAILLASVIASPHCVERASLSLYFPLLSSVNHLITSNLCMASTNNRMLYTPLLFVSWPDYLTVFLSNRLWRGFLKKVLNSFDCEYVPPLPGSNQLLIGQVINEQCSFSFSIHMFFAPEHTILFPIWTINAAIYWG